jgi:cytidyltransferase-like protein
MNQIEKKFFKLATIGGTFNDFHKGHKEYIEIALHSAEKVHIYLTTDQYAQMSKVYRPVKYERRLLRILSFLQKKQQIGKCEIIPLDSLAQLEKRILSVNYDFALVEPAYFEQFKSYLLKKEKKGKKGFSILLKPRTLDKEHNDISSTKRYHNKLFKKNNANPLNLA